MSISNIQKGKEQSFQILFYINKFGWLTLEMISELVFLNRNQSLSLSRRKIKKLLEDNLIIIKKSEGISFYLLSAKGAKILKKEEPDAKSGQNIKILNIHHRACSNWLLIDKINQGFKVYTEHEIQSNLAPIYDFEGKIPDGLYETEEGLVWVEVENSWKNNERKYKLVDFVKFALETNTNFKRKINNSYIFRVEISSTNIDALNSLSKIFEQYFNEEYIKESTFSDLYLSLYLLKDNLSPEHKKSINYYYDYLVHMVQ